MSRPIQPKARVFVNSLPKSGTHLLAKAAQLFGY
ncbi:MAG: sulfotransferase, partial [Chloroflexi bacterium]|nr:sulfotransferase [Chloroflexota bacterium]